MNIVLVNHYAGSLDLGMEFRPYYLAKEWTKKGHQVIIVGASFSHLRTKQPDVQSRVTQQTVDGITYVWIRTNRYHGNGAGRIMSMLLFSYRLFFWMKDILRAFKPELIIASSTYPFDNIPAYHLSRKFGARYCYEVHDLWPLSVIELGGYSKNHPFIMMMQWTENFAYKHADFVVSMLPRTLEHMQAHGLKKEKFCYIPNGIAVEEWKSNPVPLEHAHLIQSLHHEAKVVVGYVGGHSISNALEYLVEAAAIAVHKAPQLSFVLVGGGIEKEKLVETAQRLSLPNIHFLPAVPKNTVPDLLASMDILFLGWHNNPLYRFGISPNKLIDYMMAGKPIVHSVKAGNDMVKEARCGISVEPENPAAIVEACARLAQTDPVYKAEMGARGKEFILENNSYEILAQRFIDCALGKQNK